MGSLTTLAQSLGVAYAAGISPYATVAAVGLAARLGWIDNLPKGLEGVTAWWVIGLAGALYLVEFLATLVPGIASAWETVHTAVRPLAGAFLAAATAWGADAPVTLLAGLLGGGLALTTHAAKAGTRVAIDTSPEPVTNGIANVAELGLMAMVLSLVWEHPWIALTVAAVVLVLTILLVRAVWRMIRRTFGGGRERAAAG